jgi:hypothetical protein
VLTLPRDDRRRYGHFVGSYSSAVLPVRARLVCGLKGTA